MPPKNRPRRFLHPFAPLSLLLGRGRGPVAPASPPSRAVHLPELATAVVPIRSTSCRRRAGVRRRGEPPPFLSPLLPASLSFLPRRAPACTARAVLGVVGCIPRRGQWPAWLPGPAACTARPCPCPRRGQWPARLTRARGQPARPAQRRSPTRPSHPVVAWRSCAASPSARRRRTCVRVVP
jgi:hypothetical protein